MIKRIINYKDYNGNDQKEDFYFDLSLAELTEYEWSINEGISSRLQKIIDSNNKPDIIKYFKEILLMSVGKKSEDGKRFIKNQEIIDEFVQSPVYSIMFMELATDAKLASEFINGIIPTPEEINKYTDNA